jgi:hypothetical protein
MREAEYDEERILKERRRLSVADPSAGLRIEEMEV